jgi:hypothetical protein
MTGNETIADTPRLVAMVGRSTVKDQKHGLAIV